MIKPGFVWSAVRLVILATVYLMLCLVVPGLARAGSLSAKDVQVIVKVLGFLAPPRDEGVVAVVFTAGSPALEAEAMEIAALFGAGLKAGSGTIRAIAVDAGALAGARYVAIIALDSTVAASVLSAVRAQSIPCFTDDVAQVQSGSCVVAIRTIPKVDIVLNHSLAALAGITFEPAFRMLVHEI